MLKEDQRSKPIRGRNQSFRIVEEDQEKDQEKDLNEDPTVSVKETNAESGTEFPTPKGFVRK